MDIMTGDDRKAMRSAMTTDERKATLSAIVARHIDANDQHMCSTATALVEMVWGYAFWYGKREATDLIAAQYVRMVEREVMDS